MKRTISIGLIALLYIGEGRLSAQKFYPDDPIWVDRDRLDTPVKPEEVELSDLYDRFGHMFYDFGTSEIGSEASNVNTLDRVGSNLPLKGPIVQDTTRVELPISDDYHFREHCLLTLEIVSLNEAHRNWATPIRVYLRSSIDGYGVVGIERQSEPQKSPEDLH